MTCNNYFMQLLTRRRVCKGMLFVLLAGFFTQHAYAQEQPLASRLFIGEKVYECGQCTATFQTVNEGCQHVIKVHEEGVTLVGVPKIDEQTGEVTFMCKEEGREEPFQRRIKGETICPQSSSHFNDDNDKPWREQRCVCDPTYVAKNNRCVESDKADNTSSTVPSKPPEATNTDKKDAAGNVTKEAGFTVNPSKFDYFFGRVVSGPEHNIARSAQNLKDLTTLGIRSDSQLMEVFNQALERGTIISTKTNQFGATVMRSVNISNQGSIDVAFFYQGGNMSATPSVTTIIPKIFK